MQYEFEWDPQKAQSNRRKHGVTFEKAVSVFRDPHALSIYDEAHSQGEDRWITLGLSAGGGLLVVHHTYRELDAATVLIRIFSSRRATKSEARRYFEE